MRLRTERDKVEAGKLEADRQLAKLQLVYNQQLTSKETQELLNSILPPDKVGEPADMVFV